MTFSEAIDYTLQEVYGEHSRTAFCAYRSRARRFKALWGDRKLTDLVRRDIQAYCNERRQQVKASTVHAEVSFVNKVYRVAQERGEDVFAPTVRLRLPAVNNKRQRFLSEAEAKRLRIAIGAKGWEIVFFTIMTGLRRLEVFRLRPEDITLWAVDSETQLGVAHVHTSKTGKGRVIVLNPLAAEIAQAWLERAGNAPWLVYPLRVTKYRLPVAHNFCRFVFKPALERAGIADFRFHDLRHTSATWALQQGASLEDVQRHLGHDSIQMTERYVHWDQSALWPAAMALCKGRLQHWPKNLPPAPESSWSRVREAA